MDEQLQPVSPPRRRLRAGLFKPLAILAAPFRAIGRGYREVEQTWFPKRTKPERWSIRIVAVLAIAIIATVIAPRPASAGTAQGDGMIVYGEGTQTAPRYRSFLSAANSFLNEANANAASANVQHVIVKAAPAGSGRNEMIMGTLSSSGSLHIQRWNGSSWSSEWSDTVTGGNLPAFDIAYEQSSGEAIVVYEDNNSTVPFSYRIWNGSSWETEQTYTSARTSAVTAIALEPRSGTDEIGMAWGDVNLDLSADYWDGATNTWKGEPSTALDTSLAVTGTATQLTNWSFDLAFESTSGELQVVWGSGTATASAEQVTRTAGAAGTWGSIVTTNVAGSFEQKDDMELSADPNSDYIAYVNNSADSGNDAEAAIWNGSSWIQKSNFDTSVDDTLAGTFNNAVNWVTDGSQTYAVATYDDANAAGIDWVRYDKTANTAWAVQTDYTASPNMSNVDDKMHRFRSNPFNGKELVWIGEDSNSDLIAKKLTQSGTTLTWSDISGTVAVEDSLSVAAGTPADFAFNKYIPPVTYAQASYRWFGNTAGSISDIASNTVVSSSDSALTKVPNSTFRDDVHGLYWSFWYGGNGRWSYSSDGSNWSTNFGGDVTGRIGSIYYRPGTDKVYVLRDQWYVREGTLASNGSITWSNENQFNASDGDITGTQLSVDSTGRVWVVYQDTDTTSFIRARRATAPGAPTSWGSEITLDSPASGTTATQPRIVPMSGTKKDMYFSWFTTGTTTQSRSFRGVLWDDSAGAIGTVSTIASAMIHTGTPDSALVPLPNNRLAAAAQTPGQLYARTFDDSSWSGDWDGIIWFNVTTAGGVAMTGDWRNGDAHLFWIDGTDLKHDRALNANNVTTLDNTGTKNHLATSQVANWSHMPILWTEGTANPYNARFYGKALNDIGTNVGSPLAALNTVATAPTQGTPFRLRMNIQAGGNDLDNSGQQFKLQYAGKGAGTCSTPTGSPAGYSDVGPYPNPPSAATNDATLGSVDWSNPGNVVADDGTAATAALTTGGSTTSKYLKATGFGFNIPSSATITGVMAEVERYKDVSTNKIQDAAIRLVKANSVVGNSQSSNTVLTSVPTYRSYGHDTNLWGTSLTPSDVNSTTFGLAYSASFTSGSGTTNVNVDHIRLTVYYTDTNGDAIQFANSSAGVDGTGLTRNSNDPTSGSGAIIPQTYEDSYLFSNSIVGLLEGQQGLWDFALVDRNAPASTTYCFRAVKVTGTPGIDWVSRNSAAGNEWTSVTYGNSLFVAVAQTGSSNRVMTSPDGASWTSRTTPETSGQTWRSVTYGNGVYVAVTNTGSSNNVMTSPDGINWTLRSGSAINQWQSVTYGNGLFVAVANNGTDRVMTSTDGVSWTGRNVPSQQWSTVTYGGGQFVALSSLGTNNAMTSSDGINWTQQTGGPASSWRSVTYGDGTYVAVSALDADDVMTSPDGINWTSRTASIQKSWQSVAYGQGLFVAVASSGEVMTSPDGITWTTRTAPSKIWTSVTYGNGLFVTVSQSSGTTGQAMNSPTVQALDTYTNYPEITTAAAAIGPTIDEVMRHGNYFSAGAEQSFFWADLGL